MRGFALFLWVSAACCAQQMVTIESNVPVSPPAWAVMERRLIGDMSDAAIRYTERYVRSGGTLIWKTTGGASIDDLPESFYNFPLLYALGGDARLKEISFREWDATTRQLTFNFPDFYKEFPKHGDWFHIGEGFLAFWYLPLADPTDYETYARAQRFAGFYMNEDPEAPNYDPKLKIIRSPHTGSQGPLFGDPAKAAPYGWSKGMRSYGLPLQDVPGVASYDDLKDPAKARAMGKAMAERMYRGDVPVNLSAATLVANAYLFTGDEKYAKWIREYVGAWLERTRANSGITPDNIGLSGKPGEYQNGKWWGGQYGWSWPHGYYSIGMALEAAASDAMLVSSGDASYLELPRSNIDKLISLGKNVNGAFLVPYKKADRGWWAYQPFDRQLPAHLWFMSQQDSDWQRLEKLRKASTVDWHKATHSPYPNRGYQNAPEYREDCWNCDVEGLADWNVVADIRNKEDRSHEGPWLRFISGANPTYPEQILRVALGQVAWRMDQIRRNVLLLEYDPRKSGKPDAADVDLTKVHEHHWQTINPVTTEALVQLMLGAPQIIYNAGLLHASTWYFDPARKRPGLPPDVAALVTKVSADRTVLELVNTSPFETRDVIVQAGVFGEHQFTTVHYQHRTDEEASQPDHFTRPAPVLAAASATVNGKFFSVRLPAGTGLTLDLGVRRFANKPSYAWPWHGDRIPVR